MIKNRKAEVVGENNNHNLASVEYILNAIKRGKKLLLL